MFIQQLFEAESRRVVVTYPGRFQPFHKGHKEVFDNLQRKFGSENVFIVTSNKTDAAKSPFNFSDKLRFMQAMGIPAHNIIETDKVYDIPTQFEGIRDQVVFITVVGAPDAKRLNPGSTKKDGNPSYFQNMPSSANQLATADKHGYVIVEPEHPHAITIGGKQYDVSHGTPTRDLWNQVRNNPKQRAEFIQQLYGRTDADLGTTLDKIPTGAAPAPAPAAKMKNAKKDLSKVQHDPNAVAESNDDFRNRERNAGLEHETNNLAIAINGKVWKVIPGKGYADSPEEWNYVNHMRSWAEKKSASSGKKWTVHLTGAPITVDESWLGGYKSIGNWFLKKDGDVIRTVNGEPFTFKSKEDAVKWAMRNYKISYEQQRIIPTTNPDKNLMKPSGAVVAEGNTGISKDDETKFHAKLDTLVHDTFGKRDDELQEFAPDGFDGRGDRPKFLPWNEFIGDLKAILGDHFDVVENVVKTTIKARFVPHDPMEFGPTMLYSYYETRAGRNKGAISTRGAIQVGKYVDSWIQGNQKLLTTFSLLKGHPFERHFDLTGENVQKIADIIIGNTEGAYQMPQQQGVAEGLGLYGPFTATINTGERPKSRTKTKKFRREDDAILWAQDWLEDAPQYVFATAEVTDPDGNVVWTTDESLEEQGVAEGSLSEFVGNAKDFGDKPDIKAQYQHGQDFVVSVNGDQYSFAVTNMEAQGENPVLFNIANHIMMDVNGDQAPRDIQQAVANYIDEYHQRDLAKVSAFHDKKHAQHPDYYHTTYQKPLQRVSDFVKKDPDMSEAKAATASFRAGNKKRAELNSMSDEERRAYDKEQQEKQRKRDDARLERERQKLAAKKGINENAEELNIGDPVIITGDVQFHGKTGDIDSFGEMKRFVIVNLYNHGKHSFHSSDVSYNDYADQEDVDEGMYQYNAQDPYNSEFAPDVGMGRMTLRGWKQQLIKRTAELAQQMQAAGQDIDKAALWDNVYKKLKSMNMDPIAQEIELAQAELEKIRQRGGIRSRAFKK